jgi:hydrogenase maturation protease
MKTLIIGLGNPILGDDGVGWKIAQEFEKQLALTPGPSPKLGEGSVSVECLALAGISLMEHMIGYQRVILIDSLNTGQYPQGEIVIFSLDSLADLTYGHSASAHDLSLKGALKLGRDMGADLPADENVTIVAVEAAHVYDFTEELSPEIAKVVPKAVETVINML